MEKFRRILSVVGAAMALTVVMAGNALATPTTVDAEVATALGDVKSLVLGFIAALFAIVIVGVGVRVGIKYTKRGGSAA